MSKLVTAAPSSELVDAYLAEIAKAYGVSWSAGSETEIQEKVRKIDRTLVSDFLLKIPQAGDSEECTNLEGPCDAIPPTESAKVGAPDKPGNAMKTSQPQDEFESLAERFAALKKR